MTPANLAICWNDSQNSGRLDTYNYSIKDTIQEQPSEKTNRENAGRVQKAEPPCPLPMEPGHVPPPPNLLAHQATCNGFSI